MNAAGSVVAEYSYDAWGKLRDANTLQVYAIGHELELFLGRGYTGHEHLPWFGLINMNARLYDPVHGRFLAPDPYVQAPDFTQSFNRYSYALNNPLTYVDENGEVFWFIVGAAALINGVINGIQKAKHGGTFLGGFWRGAVVGGLSAMTGMFIGSAVGGFGGALLAGVGSGVIAGGLSAGLNRGNIIDGLWKGGLTGLLSAGTSSLIGGGIGAIAGGFVGGASSVALNGGNLGESIIGGIAGAAISYGTYHLTKYYAYKQSNANVYGINDYKTYARISSDIQRSRIWHKEYGGVLTDQGYFRAPGWARHNYGVDFDSKWLSSVKGNLKAIFHTHWDDAGRNIIVNNSYDLDPNGGFSAITSNGPSVGD